MGSHKIINLEGQVFSRLTVKHLVISLFTNIPPKWECVCTCGNVVLVVGASLTSGNTTSCGCFHKEKITKHNKANTSEYHIWHGMIQRCVNPDSTSYHNYGGRGIKVCNRWVESVENFYLDMGNRPSLKHSLDRIDNNGDYSKDNCHWATKKEQDRNTRHNRFVLVSNTVYCFADAARLLNVSSPTISNWVKSGRLIEVTKNG